MASSIWGAVLTVAVVLGSLALSCLAPLAALAVALSATLGLRSSLGVMTFVWLLNQAIGFTVFHFPRTPDSFGRGLAMGIAALLITIVARAVMQRLSSQRAPVCLTLAFVVTFTVFETVLWVASLALGGREMFTLPIVMEIAFVNGAWLIGIVALNEIAAAICKPWLGRIPMMLQSPGSI
jgi:hypothetical protein